MILSFTLNFTHCFPAWPDFPSQAVNRVRPSCQTELLWRFLICRSEDFLPKGFIVHSSTHVTLLLRFLREEWVFFFLFFFFILRVKALRLGFPINLVVILKESRPTVTESSECWQSRPLPCQLSDRAFIHRWLDWIHHQWLPWESCTTSGSSQPLYPPHYLSQQPFISLRAALSSF